MHLELRAHSAGGPVAVPQGTPAVTRVVSIKGKDKNPPRRFLDSVVRPLPACWLPAG